jgi:hypothetical protein
MLISTEFSNTFGFIKLILLCVGKDKKTIDSSCKINFKKEDALFDCL